MDVMRRLVRGLAWVRTTEMEAVRAERVTVEPEVADAAVDVTEPPVSEVADADVDVMVSEVAEPSGGELPRVRVAPVTVGPKWSPEIIKRVVRKSTPELRRCHAADPGAPAATLRFTIGTDGVVASAEALVSGAASNHPAHACVLRSLRFPPDMAGMTVSYPLR